MDKNLPYRPCVGITLFNAQGQVFVGERIDTPGAWQMPQGGIDEGESVETAAFRELYEETGTDKAEIIKIADRTIRYDLPAPLRDNIWNGQYAGQEQTWVAMRFTGADSDIHLDTFDPPEFKSWKWVALAHTPELIVPFKRGTYEQVCALFKDIVLIKDE